jgi:hypothetical protein
MKFWLSSFFLDAGIAIGGLSGAGMRIFGSLQFFDIH